MKHLLFSLAAGAALAAPAVAQQGAQTGSLIERSRGQAGTPETIGYAPDAWERMTVAVNIDGRGPYRFIVDTGAERTVISSELARSLGLSSTGDVTLASVSDVRRVPSVHIGELGVGRRTLSGIQAPALAEYNIGAQGMLGVDSLISQRVTFDFTRRELTLTNSHIDDDRYAPGEIVVRGRTRAGRMLLTNAYLDGQRITVIIDTGSQISVGNAALRRRLERARRLGQTRIVTLTGVTGDIVTAEYSVARRLQVGGVHIDDLPIAFSEVRLFALLDLEDRPAILLGMDALRLFDRVSIDFANRRVRLAPPTSLSSPPTRMAGLAPLRAR
ncbi:aspartyl protease family protein [Sphingosinicella sp.]|uniref:aspartyl protease family protein n=1 Tax=Sphingosinicella sp. TaxID=1917971 RepID=UPI004037BCF2